jgi:hypothetical protein
MTPEVSIPRDQIKLFSNVAHFVGTAGLRGARTVQVTGGDPVTFRLDSGSRRSAATVDRATGEGETGRDLGNLSHVEGDGQRYAIEAERQQSLGIAPGSGHDLKLHAIDGMAEGGVSVKIRDSAEHLDCSVDGGGVRQQEAVVLPVVKAVDSNLAIVPGDLRPSGVVSKFSDHVAASVEVIGSPTVAEGEDGLPSSPEGLRHDG